MIKGLAKIGGGDTAFIRDVGLLILRLTFGGVMLVAHGWGKLNAFAERSSEFPDPLGIGNQLSMALATGAEVVCALMLMVGLLTRFALVPLIITMVVAFFVVHGDDPWQRKELAFMYLAGYVGLFFTGPGKLSIDRAIIGK